MNRKPLLIAAVALITVVVAVAAYLTLFQTSDTARAGDLTEPEGITETTRIRPADASIGQLKAAGNINLIEELQVAARIEGFVADVLVQVGDTVNAGDLLLSLERDDLERAVEQARIDLERAVEQARIDLASSQLGLRRLLTSADEIELELAKLDVAQAQLDLQKALQDLAAARLTAPVAGSVLRLDAAPGAKVSPGTAVAALADPTRLELTVQVAETDIPRIESGQTVDVVIDAFPDQTFAGVISRIGPFTETQSGAISYPVTIQLLDNALDAVLPGMTAVAALRRETAGDRWLVPSTAVQEVDGETVVIVVRGQERLPLAVTPEGLHGEWTIVRAAGLQEGDEVVGAIVPFGEE